MYNSQIPDARSDEHLRHRANQALALMTLAEIRRGCKHPLLMRFGQHHIRAAVALDKRAESFAS